MLGMLVALVTNIIVGSLDNIVIGDCDPDRDDQC